MLPRISIPAVTDDPGGPIAQYWPLSIVLTLLVICLYTGLIVSIDNTNLGTTNGLWKTPDVSAWEHGTGTPTDDGEWLYTKSYGYLARLIPDRWVQYGTPAPVVTFRKMAMLNAIFGALASGVVFLLALRFTKSPVAACLISFIHAGAGFVLLNSINSEDIIAGYAFFVGAAFCFFEFLRVARPWLLLAAAFLFALATLFHWTLMAPGLAAFAAVLLLVMFRHRVYIWISAVWFFFFACAVQVVLLVSYFHQVIPVWAALYPTKAAPSGWVGIRLDKLWFTACGVGNYFTGAANASNFHAAFAGSGRHFMIVSWLFDIITLGACLAALLRRRTTFSLKCFALFALALVAVGEVEAFYSQPQDPQMQIQPMFATMVGLILLAERAQACSLPMRRLLAGSLAGVVLVNGIANIEVLRVSAGGDSRALSQILELETQFPRTSTVTVTQGFEGWVTWQYVMLFQGRRNDFLEHSLQLATPFTDAGVITGLDAAKRMRCGIDQALSDGRLVVASALWTQTPEEVVRSLSTVAAEPEARVYDSILRNSYRIGRKWDTSLGTFVELLPGPAR